MAPRVITMLSGTRTKELTLTVAGANGRRFALAKSIGDQTMKFTEIAAQVLAEPAEGEDTLKEALTKSGATAEQIEAAVGHFRMQQGFKDQVTPKQFATIATASEYLTVAKQFPPKKDDDDDEEEKAKKAAAAKAKAAKAQKSADIPEAVQKSLDEKDGKIEELKKSLVAETAKRERADLITEVKKSFGHVPGKSDEEMADMLMQARAAGGGLEKSLREQWAQTNDAVKDSDLLRTGGSPLTKNIAGGAIDEMNTRAKEMVKKSVGELDFNQAFVKIMDAEPGLYQRYLEENPAQRQR